MSQHPNIAMQPLLRPCRRARLAGRAERRQQGLALAIGLSMLMPLSAQQPAAQPSPTDPGQAPSTALHAAVAPAPLPGDTLDGNAAQPVADRQGPDWHWSQRHGWLSALLGAVLLPAALLLAGVWLGARQWRGVRSSRRPTFALMGATLLASSITALFAQFAGHSLGNIAVPAWVLPSVLIAGLSLILSSLVPEPRRSPDPAAASQDPSAALPAAPTDAHPDRPQPAIQRRDALLSRVTHDLRGHVGSLAFLAADTSAPLVIKRLHQQAQDLLRMLEAERQQLRQEAEHTPAASSDR